MNQALQEGISLLQREENSGDNTKYHGHTLLENYPEDGLKRCGFCTRIYLYKNWPRYKYTEVLSTITVAYSNEMPIKEPMPAIYLSLGHIADS